MTATMAKPNYLVFALLLAAFIGTAWLMSGHPWYPADDCGKNQWLTLTQGLNPLCVRGVLPNAVVNEEYQKALKQYRQEHRFDQPPNLPPGIEFDDTPLNLIDEVLGKLTRGWNLKP